MTNPTFLMENIYIDDKQPEYMLYFHVLFSFFSSLNDSCFHIFHVCIKLQTGSAVC